MVFVVVVVVGSDYLWFHPLELVLVGAPHLVASAYSDQTHAIVPVITDNEQWFNTYGMFPMVLTGQFRVCVGGGGYTR